MLCVCEGLKVYTPHMYTWEIINNKQPCVPGGWLIKAEDVILFIKSFYTVTETFNQQNWLIRNNQ